MWEGTVFGGTSSQEKAVEAGEARLAYQPALDGLRAVAVLAVIAYHDAYEWARGGFLGVDTFFVLSGFLITTLLVLEERRTTSVNLLAFWGRRIRRLLPALLLVLVAVAIYGAAEVPSIELDQLRGDSLASLFYFANWRFIWTGSSYFAMFSSPSPVRHLWSLAIEEQFYLVWPVVVLVCFSLFRHARRALVVVSLAGIAASTVIMAALYDSIDPSRAYFGTDARIHTILVGAVLAVLLVTRPPRATWVRRTVQVAGLVCAAGVLWAMHSLSDLSAAYYHGGSLAFAVGVAAVIAGALQPGPNVMRSGLALAPLVWVGRISYGLYLWHWPVNVHLTEARMGFGGSRLNLLRLAVTFAVATVSFYLVEMPIRRGALRVEPARWLAPVAVAATGIALVVATAGASAPPSYLGAGGGLPAPGRIVNIADDGGAAASVAGQSSPGVNFRTDGAVAHLGVLECPPPSADEKERAAAAVARRGSPPTVPPGGPVRVLVIGDSLGCSIAIGLGPAGAPALEVRQATIVGCGVVSDQIYDDKEPFPRGTENCSYYAPTLEAEAMAEFEPDIVLWISTWERFPLVVGDKLLRTGTDAWSRELQRRLQKAYARLTRHGARLVFMTVAPPAPASMLDGGRIVSEEFDYRFPAMNAELLRFVATHPDTRLVDVATKVCPEGAPCPTVVGHTEPRHGDGVHYQPQGAVWLSRWMLPQLLAALPPRGTAGPAGVARVSTHP